MLTLGNPNRTYSAICNANKATPIFNYVWSPYVSFTGANGIVESGAMVAVGINTYSPQITGFSTQQFIIPIQAKAFTIMTVSGTTFVNGTPFFSPSLYQGGQYDGNQTLATPIVVGNTGGWVNVMYEI